MANSTIPDLTTESALTSGSHYFVVATSAAADPTKTTIDDTAKVIDNELFKKENTAISFNDGQGGIYGRYRVLKGNILQSGSSSRMTVQGTLYAGKIIAGQGINGPSGNKAGGAGATVLGGSGNHASGDYSTVVNGLNNTIDSAAYQSTIAAGTANIINLDSSFIGAGELNYINGASHSFIGAGINNQCTDVYTFVGGGNTNKNKSALSFIGGGSSNLIDAVASTQSNVLVGGDSNKVYSQFQFLGGGSSNILTGSASAGNYSVLCGGLSNFLNEDLSVIAGGRLNRIDSSSNQLCFIGGGYSNIISGHISSIVGGYQNTINNNTYVFIGGGFNNYVSGDRSAIIGGSNNSLYNPYSIIGGGDSNVINFLDNSLSAIEGNSIFGGGSNTIPGGGYNLIVAGRNNVASGESSSIVGGLSNRVIARRSFVGGGNINFNSGDYAGIVAGQSNTTKQNYTFIGGGSNNNIITSHGSDGYSLIIGGADNTISNRRSSITCGIGCTIKASYSFIGGGDAHYISEIGVPIVSLVESNTIVGGSTNKIYGGYNFIGGGFNNIITGSSNSNILGGTLNTITGASHATAIGSNNYITDIGATVLSDSRSSTRKSSLGADTLNLYYQGGFNLSGSDTLTVVNITGGSNGAVLYVNGAIVGAAQSAQTVRYKHAGAIYVDVTSSGNAAGGADTNLKYFTYKGNTLASNGDRLKIRSCGVVGNDSSNTLKVKIGSVEVMNFPIGSLNSWVLDSEFIRSGSTTLRYNHMLGLYNGSTNAVRTSGSFISFTASSDNSITILGADTNVNNITADSMTVDYYPAP